MAAQDCQLRRSHEQRQKLKQSTTEGKRMKNSKNWNERKVFKEEKHNFLGIFTDAILDSMIDNDETWFIVNSQKGNAELVNDCSLMDC